MARRIGSIKNELIMKSREAALASVQVFNNPLIKFKSEIFITNMMIAWTYMLHAHYRGQKIEYRYHTMSPNGKRKIFDKTKNGAYKFWELERCLECKHSPVGRDTANNLRFLIGLRHEIEHQMTTRIDDSLSARFQACCINFNEYMKKLFGDENGIDKHLSFSLQFSSLDDNQKKTMESYKSIFPSHIARYIEGFDGALSEDEYNATRYAYRVIFTPKVVNHKGQADQVIEFIPPDSKVGEGINKQYAALKEVEKQKYLPSDIVAQMKSEGFSKFTINKHAALWNSKDAKNPTKNYGVLVAKTWYWYDNWLKEVRQYCNNNKKQLS